MRRAGLVVGLWLLTASLCLGTTLLWMDVQELTTKSTSVVMGRVISQRLLTAEPGVPLNQISFEISRTLKGDLQGTIVLNNPGFPGAPAFNEGEELILFIYTRNDTHVLTGFQQGSFKIVTDSSGNRVLDRRMPSRQQSLAGQRSVERLVSEILDAAK
ncbi:MAG: hypothetical protein ACWGSD_17255 [Thermodesulfobacteriota bacterium]